MVIRPFCLFAVLASVALVACSNKNDAQEQREAEAQVAAQMPAEPAALPTMETDPGDSGGGEASSTPESSSSEVSQAAAATPIPEFDVSSVAPTTATLPPFPFFKDPEGIENNLKGPDGMKSFDRHGFLAGGRYVTKEGREALFQYNLENPDTGRSYSEIEFLRNYENAIASLGGQKISAVQFTPEVVAAAGGREQIEKYWAAASPPVAEAEHHTYLLRTADKEYWIHVSTGGIIPPMGFVTVLEKQGMASSLAFLDAAAIKKELDAKGRVALYINFDTGKSTLRPDARPIIAEVSKLLVADPALELSIEGHTDNVGSADLNRELATTRARSVLGALTALGVEATRLASNGFGPDKPIADNSTDEGRAKNRRVELVKTN
jgi:outer membrane protein OmpA-like peptidoglycan-associated protein